jgi:hypothetical protein
MRLNVLQRRVRNLRLIGTFFYPLRKLLSTGLLKKLAEKLILTSQNRKTYVRHNKQAIERMYTYMVCRLPQRIFNICLPRENYSTLIKISADMCCCDAAIYLGICFMKTYYHSRGFPHAYRYYHLAVEYFTIAANQGHTKAQHMLGKMLLEKLPPICQSMADQCSP